MRSAMWLWTRIVCSLVALAWFGLAEAQYYRHARPLPQRGLKIDARCLGRTVIGCVAVASSQ